MSGTTDELLRRVVEFAEADANIRAVVVTGSTARGETHPLSDLDVELYARQPGLLLDDDSWHGQFGPLVAVEALPNPGWYPTRLLYLQGAQKVDFMIASVADLRGVEHVRPFRVVVDKDGLAPDLPLSPGPTAGPPSPEAYLECVNWFSAAAIMCAKSIVTGDPWMAKVRDRDLKDALLRMIEWDHKCRHGWDYDTWYLGKNLQRWMDPDIRSRLDECWGRFDREDSARALLASMRLFHDLAPRVGRSVSAPGFDHAAVAAEITAILGGPRG